MYYYLWNVCQDLFLAVSYIVLMHVTLGRLFGAKARRIHGIILGVACLAAGVYATLKLTSNFILTSVWNHHLYSVMIGFTLVFFILSMIFGRKENAGFSAGAAWTCAAGSGTSAGLILYKLPVVGMYPFTFNTMGNGVWSAYYMERLGGWAMAMALLYVYAVLLSRAAARLRRFSLVRLGLYGGLLTYNIYFAGRFLVPWVARARWLNWPVKYSSKNHAFWGALENFASQYAMLFIWVGLGLMALIAIAFFAENTRVRDPYEHAAQLRKLRARNRTNRRIAAAILAALALVLVILTAVKAYDTRVIELSPPETYTVEGDQILIPIEDVSDGTLHRFEYTTEKGIRVRWIVIKKPNSASFGVGLDACDVCGNAGYYMRGEQVICKRCDVVMNINTIGFKGGCNPIPLDYQMTDGSLVFALEDIIAAEREFR